MNMWIIALHQIFIRPVFVVSRLPPSLALPLAPGLKWQPIGASLSYTVHTPVPSHPTREPHISSWHAVCLK